MQPHQRVLAALQKFAQSVTKKMKAPASGEPEDQLRAPFENLMGEVGKALAQAVVCKGQSRLPGRLGRPDYAVHTKELLSGIVELKAPGTGANPERFKGHNRQQWKLFQGIPNLIYCDGNDWGLCHSSESTPPGSWADLQRVKIIEVNLAIYNTTLDNDDYVVAIKGEAVRETPVNTPAGATDNHVPLRILLEGPVGVSVKVMLSVSPSNTLTIEKTNGDPYPPEGVTVTVGSHYDVHLFGLSASHNLDDRAILATTDKTTGTCGSEELTVIWVPAGSIRGSPDEFDPLTQYSTAVYYPTFGTWRDNVVGRRIYDEPVYPDIDRAHWQMEMKFQTRPNAVISDVNWDIKREASFAYWGPDTLPLTKSIFKGATDWADDDTDNDDEDLTQNPNLTEILSIDGPGFNILPYTANYFASQKSKFQEWVEVKISNDWYVCSGYTEWRSIMHIRYDEPSDGWILDTTKTNEIVTGPIDGFADDWSDDYE